MARAQLELAPSGNPAHGDRNVHRDRLVAVGAHGLDRFGLCAQADFDVAAIQRRFVAQHELERGVAGGEGIDLDIRVHAEAQEIAVTMVHRHYRETDHQEGKCEAEIAVVVEPGNEHCDEQHRPA